MFVPVDGTGPADPGRFSPAPAFLDALRAVVGAQHVLTRPQDTELAIPLGRRRGRGGRASLSGEQSISLENRGDGIKARHIPLILTFTAG
ncbi:hypothetical protein [Paracoccus mutanolyticus]|uniref:hypothetical protein n=1 Tax=Paracoccus mutanolyticus TaxID=1499308 RepID=UPI00167294E5|nr:hypothetical protein [Paracoccus mutanolyticus]